MNQEQRDVYTVQEAMDRLGISDTTVRRLLKDGTLKEAKRDDKGRVLITQASVEGAMVQLGRAELAPNRERRELLQVIESMKGLVDAYFTDLQHKDNRIVAQAEECGRLKAEASRIPGLELRIAKLEGELRERNVELTQLQVEGGMLRKDNERLQERFDALERELHAAREELGKRGLRGLLG